MSDKALKTLLVVSLVLNIGAIYVGVKAWEYRSHINHFLEKYTRVVHEFSGRHEHLENNQGLKSDTTVPGRVVFVGTQVTAGWPLQQSFPDIEPINRAVEGQRLAGFLLRFYSDVIKLGPEAVVVEISSFQFRPQYSVEENREWTLTMIDLAQKNGTLPVIPTVIPPRSGTELEEFGQYKIADSVRVFNNWLRTELVRRELPICDFAQVLVDSTGGLAVDYSTSAVDINEKGYAVMTEELRRVFGQHKISARHGQAETTAD